MYMRCTRGRLRFWETISTKPRTVIPFAEYYTAYGKSIGKFVYAKAYGDRLMCFDYDKYYIYDKYGQLLAQYENKPRISEKQRKCGNKKR